MNRFILALVPLVAAVPAFAGNVAPAPIEPAPIFVAPIAPTYDWTGGYAGVQIGYADISPDTPGLDLDGDGAFYGLRVGYDYDFGPALVGGFAQYDKFGSIELGTSGIEVDDVYRVGMRVGRAVDANLFYAAGGYAHASNELGDADGYFAGLGYERMIGTNLSVGAEALYHSLESDDVPSVETDVTTVGLNLNFRF